MLVKPPAVNGGRLGSNCDGATRSGWILGKSTEIPENVGPSRSSLQMRGYK